MTDMMRAVHYQGHVSSGGKMARSSLLAPLRSLDDSTKRLVFSLGNAECSLGSLEGRQDDSCTGPVVEIKATIEGGVIYTSSRSTAGVPQGSKTGRVKRARTRQQHKNAGI
jgi:hypothetical protein